MVSPDPNRKNLEFPEVPGYPAMLPSSIGCILAVATIAVFVQVHRAFEPEEEEEATPKMRRSSRAAPWMGWGIWSFPKGKMDENGVYGHPRNGVLNGSSWIVWEVMEDPVEMDDLWWGGVPILGSHHKFSASSVLKHGYSWKMPELYKWRF